MSHRRFVALALVLAASCGTPPPPREAKAGPSSPARVEPPPDPCAGDGAAPVVPLSRAYAGLLARARCQAEVNVIMSGVADALGVGCDHCHVKGDYPAMTRNKQVANWMATVFAVSLRHRDGGAVTCRDCHTSEGHGHAKLLGQPRSPATAVEWMTTVLVERFVTSKNEPLYCRSCHGANLGEAGFGRSILLRESLFR